jgi:hypothetical protein
MASHQNVLRKRVRILGEVLGLNVGVHEEKILEETK